MPRRTLFVTTALPYANGPFHIGHIMEYVQADIWVRFQRMQGHTVHFVCADDTHGAAIMLRAEAEGITPEELVAGSPPTRARLPQRFHISFDHWDITDSPDNTELSQDIYLKLKRGGPHLCQACRAVLRSGQGHVPARPLHQGRMPEMRHQGPIRRRLRELQLGLRAHRSYQSLLDALGCDAGAQDRPSISSSGFPTRSALHSSRNGPQGRAGRPPAAGSLNKAQEWLGKDGKGLADWDISRDAPYFGIPIPDAPGKYFYVWLDAPVGYLASLKNTSHPARRSRRRDETFEQFLADPETRQIHFIGKDIVYFHTLFWPAMLKFAGARTRCRITFMCTAS